MKLIKEMRFFWLSLLTITCSEVPFTHICEWKGCSPSSGSIGSSGWIAAVATIAVGSALMICLLDHVVIDSNGFSLMLVVWLLGRLLDHMSLMQMVWFDWCQVIDWHDSLDESDILIKMDHWYDTLDENDICQIGNQLIKMDHCYDALMKMDQWVFMMHSWYIWWSGVLMQRWIIIILSWLIRCKNGWTPNWSVKALTRRCFTDWVILGERLDDPCLYVE